MDTYLPLHRVAPGTRAPTASRRPSPSGSRRCWRTSWRIRASRAELEAFFDQRLEACDEAPASLRGDRRDASDSAGEYWRERFDRLRHAVPGAGWRHRCRRSAALEAGGADRDHRLRGDARVPAAARARREHPAAARRGHGGASPAVRRAPSGCWLPECAYRPRGPWAPWPTAPATRRAPRDRGASGRRGVPVLLRRRAHGHGAGARSASTARVADGLERR